MVHIWRPITVRKTTDATVTESVENSGSIFIPFFQTTASGYHLNGESRVTGHPQNNVPRRTLREKKFSKIKAEFVVIDE